MIRRLLTALRLFRWLLDSEVRKQFERQRLICQFCPDCDWASDLCRRHQWDVEYLMEYGEMNPHYDNVQPEGLSDGE
jgi:hypothetical protein